VLARSQGTARAAHLYAQISAFVVVRWMSNRRVVNVQSSIATGINVDGHRKILGLDVVSAEDGAGWLASGRRCPWRRGRSPATNLVAVVLSQWSEWSIVHLSSDYLSGWRHGQWRYLLLHLGAECALACMSP
jgi:Transposase, Mutator family